MVLKQVQIIVILCIVLSHGQTYPTLKCGDTLSGEINESDAINYYLVNLNTSTTFYGVFDSCKSRTNFDTMLYINDLNGNTLTSVDDVDTSDCWYSRYHAIVVYNMTSYPNNGITNNKGTFLFGVGGAGNGYGDYTISLQCGNGTLNPTPLPTPAPTPIPTPKPTLPKFSNNALKHYIGVSKYLNWSAAVAYCASTYNAPLAIIHSEKQNKKVAYQCYKTGGSQCWIGIRNNGLIKVLNNGSTLTNWYWIDKSANDYSKWSYGSNDYSKSYATLDYSDGYWNGQTDFSTNYYGYITTNTFTFVCGTSLDSVSDNSNDITLGLGLGFGLGIPLIIIMVIIIYCFFFRKKKNVESDFLELPETPNDNGTRIDTGQVENSPKGGMGWIDGCIASPHLKSWILTLTLWVLLFMKLGCVAGVDSYCHCSWCNSSSSSSYSTGNYWDTDTDTDTDDACSVSSCDSDYIICNGTCSFAYAPGGWWIGVFVFTLLLYVIEVWLSSSLRYLSQAYVKETVYEYVNRIKKNPPYIWWAVECYHYETRTRIVTYTDANGNTQTRTETYQERVVTHRARDNYRYNSWSDVSNELEGLHEYKLTKITYYKNYCFANDETRNDYNYKVAEFKRINNRDVYQDFSTGMDLKGYTSKMLAEVSPGVRPDALKLEWFLLASFCLFTPCYRMWFASIVGNKKKHTFMKSVNIY